MKKGGKKMELLSVTLTQITVMFCFIGVGFAIRKLKIVEANVGSVLACLETFVFMPLLCFRNFSTYMTVENIKVKWPIFIFSVAVFGLVFLFSKLISGIFSKDKYIKGVYVYSFTVPNVGYFGYPLIEAVFGKEGLFNFMLFCVPLYLFIYTFGMNMLMNRSKFTLKRLLNPVMIGITLGMAVGLIGISLPAVVTKTVSTGAACMGPCAMLLTGYVLAKTPIKQMFTNGKMYLASIIRLVVIPFGAGALVYLVCYLLKLETIYTFLTVAALCLPMGLNGVVFPEAAGKDGTAGVQACCISSLFGIITIPTIFMLLKLLGITL